MSGTLRNHVGEGRFDSFDFINQYVFNLTDGVGLYIPQRGVQETVSQFQAESLQYVVGNLVGSPSGACKAENLHTVGKQCDTTPGKNSPLCYGFFYELTDYLIHTEKRNQSGSNADDGQNNGQSEFLTVTACITKQGL